MRLSILKPKVKVIGKYVTHLAVINNLHSVENIVLKYLNIASGIQLHFEGTSI